MRGRQFQRIADFAAEEQNKCLSAILSSNEMNLDQTTKLTAIISSIAIPLVIGYFGWRVQQTIAEQGLRKDYTDIALRVLAQADTKNDEDLRKWAVALLDRNSPVPFSEKARDELFQADIPWLHIVPFTLGPHDLDPPLPWINEPQHGFRSLKDAEKNYRENADRVFLNNQRAESLAAVAADFQKNQRVAELKLQVYDQKLREAAAKGARINSALPLDQPH